MTGPTPIERMRSASRRATIACDAIRDSAAQPTDTGFYVTPAAAAGLWNLLLDVMGLPSHFPVIDTVVPARDGLDVVDADFEEVLSVRQREQQSFEAAGLGIPRAPRMNALELAQHDTALRAVRVIQRVLCAGDDSGDFVHAHEMRAELERTQADLITNFRLTDRPGPGVWACETAIGVMKKDHK